jgi:hypothetical protein
MTRLIEALTPVSVSRRQRNVVVVDGDGLQLVSLRVHLIIDLPEGRRLGAFMYFSAEALTEEEIGIIDTAVALAVQTIDPTLEPVVVMARAGQLRVIDSPQAMSGLRIARLRDESLAYQAEWSATAA